MSKLQKQRLTKGFFLETLDKAKIEKAVEFGANAVWVPHKTLNQKILAFAHNKGLAVYPEMGIFLKDSNDCPCGSELRTKRLAEIEKLLRNFKVDGFWLDYIRFPVSWETIAEKSKPQLKQAHFCKECQENFANSGISDLGEWKSQQITSFVEEIRRKIDQLERTIVLGIFSVPLQKEDLDGAIENIYGQNFVALAEYIDVFSPMLYHRMVGRAASWISEHVSYLAKLTGKPILPIIQARDMPDLDKDYINEMTDEEFAAALKEVSKPPSTGVIVFTLEKTVAEGRLKKSSKSMISAKV